MKIETHNRLADPRSIEATRALIRDQYNTPVALILELDDGAITVHTAADPKFQQILRDLGVLDTVMTTTISGRSPEHGRITIG